MISLSGSFRNWNAGRDLGSFRKNLQNRVHKSASGAYSKVEGMSETDETKRRTGRNDDRTMEV